MSTGDKIWDFGDWGIGIISVVIIQVRPLIGAGGIGGAVITGLASIAHDDQPVLIEVGSVK